MRVKVRDLHSGWTLSAGTASTFIAQLSYRNKDFRLALFPLDKEGFDSDTSHAENCPLFSRSRHPPLQSLKLDFLFTYDLMILSGIIRVSEIGRASCRERVV